MLLNEMMKYYSAKIERQDSDLSITSVLFLSSVGVALVSLLRDAPLIIVASSVDPVSPSSTHHGDSILHLGQ